jgi:hypothetical protein
MKRDHRLSESEIRYIRYMYVPYHKDRGSVGLARLFNISPGTVRNILKGGYTNVRQATNI